VSTPASTQPLTAKASDSDENHSTGWCPALDRKKVTIETADRFAVLAVSLLKF